MLLLESLEILTVTYRKTLMWIMVTQLIAIRPSPDNDGGHDWPVVAMVWSKA